MDFRTVLILLAGLFTIAAAAFDWDWFMNARKARGIIRTFGRNGARIVYGVLGVAIAGLGVALLIGAIR